MPQSEKFCQSCRRYFQRLVFSQLVLLAVFSPPGALLQTVLLEATVFYKMAQIFPTVAAISPSVRAVTFSCSLMWGSSSCLWKQTLLLFGDRAVFIFFIYLWLQFLISELGLGIFRQFNLITNHRTTMQL